MNRSVSIILVMGLGSVLVLSMLMKYFLQIADERQRPPVVQALTAAYGDRLDAESRLALEDTPAGKKATLTIFPVLGVACEQLARDMGGFLWRRLEPQANLAAVEVVCRPWGQKEPVRYAVAKPLLPPPPPRPKGSGAAAPPVKAPGAATPPVK